MFCDILWKINDTIAINICCFLYLNNILSFPIRPQVRPYRATALYPGLCCCSSLSRFLHVLQPLGPSHLKLLILRRNKSIRIIHQRRYPQIEQYIQLSITILFQLRTTAYSIKMTKDREKYVMLFLQPAKLVNSIAACDGWLIPIQSAHIQCLN